MNLQSLEKRLKKHAEAVKGTIVAPFELKAEHKEVPCMQKPKFRRMAVAAAICAVCIFTVSLTPFAGTIKGFFKDVTRWDGAITGTEYVNATNEVEIAVLDLENENGETTLELDITFINKDVAPFVYIEELLVKDYKILDAQNHEIVAVSSSLEDGAKGLVTDGKASVRLSAPAEKMRPGETYTLQIESLYGMKKADAPLKIQGFWTCEIA